MKSMKILRRKKSSSGDGVNIDSMPNANGWVPYRRMLWLWSLIGVVVLAMTWPVWNRIVFRTPPDNLLDPAQMSGWVMLSIVIPHLITYTLGAVSALAILPQSTMKYMRWLSWQSMGRLIITFAVMEFIIVLFSLMSIMGMDEDAFITATDNEGLTRAATLLWNLSIMMVVIPPWVAYRQVWKCYRLLGAQTMQNRYEADLRKMEINNSGQFFDKVTRIFIPWLTGRDGNSPQYMVLWIILSYLLMMITYSFGSVGLHIMYSMGLLGVSPAVVALAAAVAKRRDGKPSLKRVSVLSLVRGPDTVDTYNPSHTGVRQFDRY